MASPNLNVTYNFDNSDLDKGKMCQIPIIYNTRQCAMYCSVHCGQYITVV